MEDRERKRERGGSKEKRENKRQDYLLCYSFRLISVLTGGCWFIRFASKWWRDLFFSLPLPHRLRSSVTAALKGLSFYK